MLNGNDDLKIKRIIQEARKTFPPILKGGFNPLYKSKYPKLEDILTAIEEPFEKFGLFLSNSFINDERGYFLIVAITHLETGDSIKAEIPLLMAKNEMQPYGSAVTYARRYALCALLNIIVEDDDGNATSSNQPKQQQSTPPKANTQAPKNNNYQTQAPPKTIPPKSTPPQTLSAVDQIKNLFNSLDAERRNIADWYYRQKIEDAKANKLSNKEMETLYNNINGIKYTHLDDLYSGINKRK